MKEPDMRQEPIRVISKARNNRLMEAKELLGMSSREMAEHCGISYGRYMNFESLSSYPSKESVEKICKALGESAEYLFPDYLRGIASNTSTRYIPEAEVLSLHAVPVGELPSSSGEELNTKLLGREVRDAMENNPRLSGRHVFVINSRFGMNGEEEKTIEEVAKELNVSRERVRQIEAQALRYLRHPSFSKQFQSTI